MRLIRYILLALALILGLSFASLNAGVVKFDYYLGMARVPLSLLLLLAFLAGAVLVMLVVGIKYWRLRVQVRSLQKKVKQLES